MREHLDTMPIWEAYRAGCECPLCEIRQKNEAMYIDNFLGASVMEPDTRVEVNQKGFCQRHFAQMFVASNRLGLALMTHTYMKETMARLQKSETAPQKGGLFRCNAPAPKNDGQAAVESCILCERLDHTMERYVYTLLYMYEHEKAFREAFAASKGLCLPHYFQVMQDAPRHLSGKTLEEFSQTAMRVERENLARVEKDLEWFTLKFDYRNKDKPWGNSQDAVERAINKLRGKCVGDG